MNKEIKDNIRDLICDSLGEDAYFCTRVWSAWSYNTMKADDFEQIVYDDDFIENLVDEMFNLLETWKNETRI